MTTACITRHTPDVVKIELRQKKECPESFFTSNSHPETPSSAHKVQPQVTQTSMMTAPAIAATQHSVAGSAAATRSCRTPTSRSVRRWSAGTRAVCGSSHVYDLPTTTQQVGFETARLKRKRGRVQLLRTLSLSFSFLGARTTCPLRRHQAQWSCDSASATPAASEANGCQPTQATGTGSLAAPGTLTHSWDPDCCWDPDQLLGS